MVKDLIDKVFETRNAAHRAHWATESYAAHQALGAYYDGVIDLLDKYVEAHQGAFGLVEKPPEDGSSTIIKAIHDDLIWMNQNREKIAKNVPALENILDELSGLHMKTLYKLENLR